MIDLDPSIFSSNFALEGNFRDVFYNELNDEIIFAVAKDITDKKRQENERIEHISNLSNKNKSFQKLTYTTSHDLRAPVDNVLAILQFINKIELSEENQELIDHLGTATTQLKNNLNTYIDNLTKSQEITIEIESIDFNTCLAEVIYSVRNLLEASNTSIESDFSEAPRVIFNATYLKSILLNLISNAVKYVKEDSSPEISIYTKLENGKTKLIFQDKGMGFSLEETKGRIFKLRQTFHKDRDSKGIGLYLVHMHVTSLGGSIEVESEINKGTKFIITFKNDSLKKFS